MRYFVLPPEYITYLWYFSLFDSIYLADAGHPGRGLHATVRLGTTAA
jgi:hypothetical protein